MSELEIDERTAKRAHWEAFEFSIKGENQIRVVNASYDDTDEHEYVVTVDQTDDGTLYPMFCDCPAYHHRDKDCKHMVAVAIRPVVMDAAWVYTRDTETPIPDGGIVIADAPDVDETEKECDEDWCPGPRDTADDPLPCFDCYEQIQ